MGWNGKRETSGAGGFLARDWCDGGAAALAQRSFDMHAALARKFRSTPSSNTAGVHHDHHFGVDFRRLDAVAVTSSLKHHNSGLGAHATSPQPCVLSPEEGRDGPASLLPAWIDRSLCEDASTIGTPSSVAQASDLAWWSCVVWRFSALAFCLRCSGVSDCVCLCVCVRVIRCPCCL